MRGSRSPLDVHDIVYRSCEQFTQEDFAGFAASVPPGDLCHYELIDGFIVREPPAGWPHGEVEGEIVFRLKSFLDGRGLGRSFGSSQGFEFPSGDTVEPDVSFVSAARWGTAPRPRKFLRVVPELVFEILSPSTARIDLGPKRRVYARNGVLEYVLVDSERRVLTVFRGEERRSVGEELGADATFSSRVLPGFGFRVGELFEEL
ncbi:MAG: Uma2 family endonuclease [Planctomycetes bacterium]|nr:Uma2 family endonuclease [Planctomycetota bacterium]